ncbi:MAG: hypothetical protein IJD09_02975 [Clostridia bacterium]|nr:hypothetical protein [Clostridia bacterium]
MKRILSVLLILTLLLAVAGCKKPMEEDSALAGTPGVDQKQESVGEEGDTPLPTPQEPVVEPTPEDPKKEEPVKQPDPVAPGTVELSAVIPQSSCTFEYHHLKFKESSSVSTAYPGFTVLRSTQDLEKFRFAFAPRFDFSQSKEQLKKYNDAYFEKQSLILLWIDTPAGNVTARIAGLHLADEKLEISLLYESEYDTEGPAVVSTHLIALEPEASFTVPQEVYLQTYRGHYDRNDPSRYYQLEKDEYLTKERRFSSLTTLPQNPIPFKVKAFSDSVYPELDSPRKPIILRSVEEKNAFVEQYREHFEEKFLPALAQYEESYFKNHSLVILLLEEVSGSYTKNVTHVSYKDGVATVYLFHDTQEGYMVTDDMREWQYVIEVEGNLTSVNTVNY